MQKCGAPGGAGVPSPPRRGSRWRSATSCPRAASAGITAARYVCTPPASPIPSFAKRMRILVSTRGAVSPQQALPKCHTEAQRHGGTATVLHVSVSLGENAVQLELVSSASPPHQPQALAFQRPEIVHALAQRLGAQALRFDLRLH